MVVAIEVDTMYSRSPSSGVMDSANYRTKLDHGVLSVGYGEEIGVDYWLVENHRGKIDSIYIYIVSYCPERKSAVSL